MPLIKIKEKYQVTIPASIRKKLPLNVGDVLQAELEDDHIVLKPQLVMDKARSWERFRAVLQKTALKNKNISDEEVIEDVLEAIREVRKAKHA